jgi:hypothetical protein
MRERNSITHEEAKHLFDYQEDGSLIWKNPFGFKTKKGDVAGHLRKNGYVAVSINKKMFLLHRIVFLWHHGHMPSVIDHVDSNSTNNKIENLREATQSQNMMNRAVSTSCKSGYKGVYFVEALQKWRAYISVNRKNISIGYFLDKHEAAKAYNKAAFELRGNFAKLNTIEEIQ